MTPVPPFAIVPPLITIEQAKAQLRITDALHDLEITLAMQHASDAILRYMGSYADPAWTAASVPSTVQRSILLLLTHFYEHRGDDMTPAASGGTPDADVWAAIGRLLARDRLPTIA